MKKERKGMQKMSRSGLHVHAVLFVLLAIIFCPFLFGQGVLCHSLAITSPANTNNNSNNYYEHDAYVQGSQVTAVPVVLPPTLLLLLHSDGYLVARNLSTGEQLWESSTLGDVVTVDVIEPPSDDAMYEDPFALPFFIHGSGLYSVIPQRRCEDRKRSSATFSEECSTPNMSTSSFALKNRFFANISNVLRKRHFFVNQTDFFISSDASVLDIDSQTGDIIDASTSSSERKLIRPWTQTDSMESMGVPLSLHDPISVSTFQSTEEAEEVVRGDRGSVPELVVSSTSLSPRLHVVRHNIRLSAYKIGAYKWSITFAQLDMVERHPFLVTEEVDREAERHPRFLSRIMDRLLDTTYTFYGKKKDEVPSSHALFVLREVNKTHIAAWSERDQTDIWSVPVANECYPPRQFRQSFSTPFPSDTPKKRVTAAWVWTDGAIRRIPFLSEEEDFNALLGMWNDTPSSPSSQRNPAGSFILPYHPADLSMSLYATGLYRSNFFPLYGNRPFDIDAEDREDRLSHRGKDIDSTSVFWAERDVAILYFFHLFFFMLSSAMLAAGLMPRTALQRSHILPPRHCVTLPIHHQSAMQQFMRAKVQHNPPQSHVLPIGDHRLPSRNSVSSAHSTLSSGSYFLNADFQRQWNAGAHRISGTATASSTTATTATTDPTVSSTAAFTGKLFQLQFNIMEKVGFGGEGSIFRVEHKVTHVQYAIKAIRIQEEEEKVVEEAMLHGSFDHPHVVRFFFCWIEEISAKQATKLELFDNDDGMDSISYEYEEEEEEEEYSDSPTRDISMRSLGTNDTYRAFFILMEYCEAGTLADKLEKRKEVNRLENLRYIESIAMGLQYLHQHDVAHRDLKPTNIFVTNDNVLKIGDFGMAKRRKPPGSSSDLTVVGMNLGSENSTQGGSPLYSSPEQLTNAVVTKLSDIYSLALVIVELYSHFTTLHERIDVFSKARRGVLPECFDAIYVEEKTLVSRMLEESPVNRPSAAEVLRIVGELIHEIQEREREHELNKQLGKEE